jgi:hypothetical protein
VRYRLAIDPDPGRFAGWTVESAERCLIEEIGADSAVDLLGTLGSSEARAASGRLSVKPDSAASWDNAEAAQGVFFDPPPGSSCSGSRVTTVPPYGTRSAASWA